MKNLSIVCLLFLFNVPAFAQPAQKEQEHISIKGVRESELVMSKGLQTSLQITLPDVRKKVVDRVWNAYVRNRFGSRATYDRKAKEFTVQQARVSAISAYPVNLISRTAQLGHGVQLHLWVDMQGAYLAPSTSPRRLSNAYSVLEDFATELEREKIRLRIEAEEKELRHLESNLRQLKNAHTRYHREIEFAEERIKRANANIQQNEKAQLNATAHIKTQLQQLEAVKKQLHQL